MRHADAPRSEGSGGPDGSSGRSARTTGSSRVRLPLGLSLLFILVGATVAGAGAVLGYALGLLPDHRAPGWAFVLALILIGGFVSVRTPLMVGIAGRIQDQTLQHRRRFIRALARFPYDTYRAFGPDALYHRMIDLAQRFNEASMMIAQGWQVLARILAAYVVIAIMAPSVFLVLAIVTIALGLGLVLGTQRVLTHERVVREAQTRLHEGIAELLRGFKALKLNPAAVREFFAAELAAPSDSAGRAGRRASRLLALNAALTNAVRFGVVGLALYVGPQLGDGTVGPEVLAAVTLIIAMPLYVLDQTPLLARALEARRTMDAFLLSVEAAAPKTAVPAAPAEGAEMSPPDAFTGLEVVDLVYRYRDPTATAGFTMGPVSLRLEPGTITFLVGGNGGGKTTLLNLIVGVMPPTGGEIRINGRPPDAALRAAVCSVVFADPVLFHRPYGLSAGQRAALPALVEELGLPRRVVADDGTLLRPETLSTGQRKRLALALTLLEDRPLLLLDEFAADQDPDFRRRFYQKVLPDLKAGGRTILAISHDDQWFDVADQIIHMDGGQRVDVGTVPEVG